MLKTSLKTFLLVGALTGHAAAQETTSTQEGVTAPTAQAAAPAAQATVQAPAAQTAAVGVGELERRVEVLAGEIERMKLGEAAVEADQSQYGMGPAASKVYRSRGISLGSYGEFLYRNFEGKNDMDKPSGKTDILDTYRIVAYLGYKFNDEFVFNSEIEFEHAGHEVSVEFAYLDYMMNPMANVRVGMVLVPVGLVNELHEPTVFLPARRSETEQRIIPTTWRENGAGLFGDVGPISYRAYIVNGLYGGEGDEPTFSASGIRGGRQGGAEAKAEDWGFVGRVDLTAVPGLLVGVSGYRDQADQSKTTKVGSLHQEMPVSIYEAHFDFKAAGLTLRGLAARADLKNAVDYNRRFELSGKKGVGSRMQGYYLEAGYDVLALFDVGEQALTPYVRWEALNTQLLVPVNATRDPAQDTKVATVGIAFQPIDQIIFKGDFQNFSNKAHSATDQVNIAAGYVF